MRIMGIVFFLVLNYYSSGTEVSPVFGYHNNIGIPKAKELKYLENSVANAGRIVGGNQVSAASVYPYLVSNIYIKVYVKVCTMCE